jgi:hypothetical protein
MQIAIFAEGPLLGICGIFLRIAVCPTDTSKSSMAYLRVNFGKMLRLLRVVDLTSVLATGLINYRQNVGSDTFVRSTEHYKQRQLKAVNVQLLYAHISKIPAPGLF